MLTAAQDRQRHRLFAAAVQGMGRRVESATEAGQMLDALGWGMRELDRTLAESPARHLNSIACRAGCGHCCSVPVDVQAHEVFFAAEHIQINFSPADLAAVIARAGAHRAQISTLTNDERSRRLSPCPLLDTGGRCSIYAGRPEICRAHHASDAAVCAAATHPAEFNRVHIPALQARMFAVMLGLDEAIEAEGFDDRAYDFGSALHEALTDSLCRVRWLRRETAFPDSCLAERE